jgi:hypothetical protein
MNESNNNHEPANGTKPVLGDAFRWDEQAYDLTKEKGQIGAILFCEEMIQDKQKQINKMQFYDGEQITALQNSMMDWGAIRSRVEKGFA